MPTWIINNNVYAYKQGKIANAQENITNYGIVESYNGDDTHRSSITIKNQPVLTLPNIAIIFGGLISFIVTLIIGRKM